LELTWTLVGGGIAIPPRHGMIGGWARSKKGKIALYIHNYDEKP